MPPNAAETNCWQTGLDFTSCALPAGDDVPTTLPHRHHAGNWPEKNHWALMSTARRLNAKTIKTSRDEELRRFGKGVNSEDSTAPLHYTLSERSPT
jgi:hypothetical protein